MDTSVWIWIIVGVLVVAIIVVVALAVSSRGRAEKKRQAEHDKAEKLRAEARETELAARESEARAAQTKADAASAAAAAQQAQAQAAQADVDARRLADSVGEHESEATQRRAEQQEALRKADEVDPYVTTDASHDDRTTVRDGDTVRTTTPRTATTPCTTPATESPQHPTAWWVGMPRTPVETTPSCRTRTTTPRIEATSWTTTPPSPARRPGRAMRASTALSTTAPCRRPRVAIAPDPRRRLPGETSVHSRACLAGRAALGLTAW